jgi:hypothetical protein
VKESLCLLFCLCSCSFSFQYHHRITAASLAKCSCIYASITTVPVISQFHKPFPVW